MPTATTFTSLQALVRKYIERGAASDVSVYETLPELINNAERQIMTDLNVTGVRQVVNAAMTSGTSIYPKPVDWRRTVEINFSGGTGLDQSAPLYPRAYSYCRTLWPDATATDTPQFYADYDDEHMLIAPTPDAAYPFEMIYYAEPALLDDTNETNWITEKYPHLLLYATLLEVAPFMNNDARVGTWQAKYAQALSSIAGDDLKKVIDRSATRQES